MALVVITESYYTINAPGVIKSNRKYTVIVALHEANNSCLMRVGIEGPGFKEFKDVNLEPYESKLLEFMPEKITSGDYKLTAEGLSGLIFRNESRLNNIIGYGPKIYIQTDKAIYKPEDVVRFRVLILDEHTRPLDIKDPVNVEITDSAGNRVKLYENITLTYGVYTGKFQLSKYPALGTWNIKVVLGGRYEYSDFKTINILNYILPKFSVYLKTPTDIVLEDGYIRVVIYGKYVFNKYVEGNATVELWNDYAHMLLQTKQLDVNNLGFVEFNIKNEKDFENVYGLSVRANLTEKHTGRTQTEKQDIYLHKQRYNLQIPYDEIEFENNKPYRLEVKVSHWTGAPVLDRKSPVTMVHGNNSYEAFLDENGVATFEFEHDSNANHIFQFKDTKLDFSNIFTSQNLMLNNREFYCRLK
ncbi:CD109 antigen-like [Lucilia sericata]|uniref:CD109 antigen-like n=1 Tax=Lucilia sericata TaxID=13632 RepID=UPI0018A83412|nr:CD109 antigen-like [Lucilia sericata]